MKIEDVENLANLARISLSDEEKKDLLIDMEGILNYVKQIELIDLKDIEEDYKTHNVWREDKEENLEFSKDLIISQFPDSRDSFLKVKKIL